MNDRPNCFLNTQLWALFETKAKEKGFPTDPVKTLCLDAEKLSTQVTTFFNDFTLHDGTHSAGVCNWMYLLLGDRCENANIEELAVLLMSACCHDLGMIVQSEEKDTLLRQARAGTVENWLSYFRRHPEDKSLLQSRDGKQHLAMLQRYVREIHHLRMKKVFSQYFRNQWSALGVDFPLTLDCFCTLCASHGSELSHIETLPSSVDVDFCAVLLRLADALDYDAARAPDILYHFLGIDQPAELAEREKLHSSEEWMKNRAGCFTRNGPSSLIYKATCTQPRLEAELNSYLDWLRAELLRCYNHLESYCPRWRAENNPLPLLLSVEFERIGYSSAKFQLKVDQDGVMKLLSGDELYGDRGVFVRELLQNSIDAVLTRRACDPHFSETDGWVKIDTWTDDKYYWFRIQDNGIGMNQDDIENYFLNVGRSYYSDEDGLKKDLLRSRKQTNFQPTSRFGIGILSCFMGGDNDNLLEVSTKRWSEADPNPNPALRLDVTGLHGYYVLTELSDAVPGEPMHSPGEPGRDEYLRDVGTTLCVRLNLLEMGTLSIREELDRYICFPKVQVSFEDYNTCEAKTYPTQQELESLLSRLNPDFDQTSKATPHVYTMSDENFNTLKSKFPGADWSNIHRPILTLWYHPLRQISNSPDLSGAILDYSSDLQYFECPLSALVLGRFLDGDSKKDSTFIQPADSLNVTMYFRFSLDNSLQYRFSVQVMGINPDKLPRPMSGSRISDINYHLHLWRRDDLSGLFSCDLSADEIAIHRFLFSENVPSATAYNGISVDKNNLRTIHSAHSVILLSGNNRPEVNLARNMIIDIPFSTACDLAFLFWRCSISENPYSPNCLNSLPAYMFYKYLESHPCDAKRLWASEGMPGNEAYNSFSSAEFDEKSPIVKLYYESTITHLKAALLRKAGYVLLDPNTNTNDRHLCTFIKDERDQFDLDGFFPALLFYRSTNSDIFGTLPSSSGEFTNNCFSRSHPFSHWLIENREKLQTKALSVYNRIIAAMAESENANDLIQTLNTELVRLRSLSGNPFHVQPNLQLDPNEIVTR